MIEQVEVSPRLLEQLAAAIFCCLGAGEVTSRTVADALVDADVAGHPSHGVLRIPEYVAGVRDGLVRASAVPTTTAPARAVRVVDGAWAFGAVAMERAVQVGCEAAGDTGVAAVAVVRTNHFGRLGRWVERVVDAGFVGLLLACEPNGPYTVAPFGGTSATLTTNPIAFGLPRSGTAPIVGDFATATVAWGKLERWRQLGEQPPPGVILDAEGRQTLDIGKFMDGGAIRVFGGHKGSALALMVELFASVLTAAPERCERRPLAQSGLLLVFDPAVLGGGVEAVAERAAEVVTRVTSSRAEAPRCRVLAPGDIEAEARSAHRDGVPVPRSLLRDLRSLACELGVGEAVIASLEQAGRLEPSSMGRAERRR